MRNVTLLIALGLLTSGCHDPRRGQTSANELPVANGTIVLLKRGKEVGAFILKNQKAEPERTDFDWYYRCDGKGTFSTNDSAVMSGFVTNASPVARSLDPFVHVTFASFSAGWSANTDGLGWVYFSRDATDFKSADFLMCVTTETNLAHVNANDRRWDYRARPRVNIRELGRSQRSNWPR